MKARLSTMAVFFLILSLAISGCAGETAESGVLHLNQYSKYIEENYVNNKYVNWVFGRALPELETPAATLDALDLSLYTPEEQTMMAVLQGVINSQKPRILLYGNPDNNSETWPEILSLQRKEYPENRKYEVVKKYQKDIKGAVLYDTSKSEHYINLACSVAGIKRGIPMTKDTYKKISSKYDMNFPVIDDLTKLEYTSATDIYNYFYENYWHGYAEKFIVNLSPSKNPASLRDMAAACGTAVVWLNCYNPDEEALILKFFENTTERRRLVLGSWPEGSAVEIEEKYDISTLLPADFYNSTIYAGIPQTNMVLPVPELPYLQDKVYISLYINNAEVFNPSAMEAWKSSERGDIPVNWVVKTEMLDFGPGLFNDVIHFNSNDCFAAGLDNYPPVTVRMDEYASFLQNCLERYGIRVMTSQKVPDEERQREYTKCCQNLYGKILTGNDLMNVKNTQDIYKSWEQRIKEWKGGPLFLSAQVDFSNVTPEDITKLKNDLNELQPGKIEFLRGDHFAALSNIYNKETFNLTLISFMNASENKKDCSALTDGAASPESLWTAEGNEKWLEFDFGKSYYIRNYVVRHAGSSGLDPSLNTREFTFETSTDGKKWVTADYQKDNTSDVSRISVGIEQIKVRYARIVVKNPGDDGIARISEVEIYGTEKLGH